MSSSVDIGTFGTSLDELYRLHAGTARRVARSITHNDDDAADAVAEAFAGVLDAMSTGRLPGPESFRPYLLAATRNASIDILRRTGRLTPTDEPGTLDGVAVTAGPSDRVIAREDSSLVAEAFAELPPRWRAVLWLTEVERLAPRDAAPLLDLTPNNVAQLAVRARGRLRQRYVQMHVRNHATGDCLEATELLGGLVAGELTTVQSNRVRGHLSECAECRDRLAELEDLGLSLRRAAIPLPAALHGVRRRWWPWGSRRRGGDRGVAGRSSRNGVTWVTRVDPSAPGTLVDLVSSPAVQNFVATVTAGLLALGIGAAVIRESSPRPADPRRAGPQVQVPATRPVADSGRAPADPTTGAQEESTTATTAPPETTTSTAPPETTTTVPAAAAPASRPAPTAAAPAPFVPAGPLARASPSLVAQAAVRELPIFDSPGAASPRLALANPQSSGAPLVLLVTDRQQEWLQVLLPVRPNGSTGWIRENQVTQATHDFRMIVELGAHRLTAYRGTDVLLSTPIAVGTRAAPTPGGLFYTKELFQPLDRFGNYDPGGPYGPYAYGLSGFSEVLYEFAGGDGQFGIHGTNEPSLLGHDVSHGCIRMSNEAITFLATTLPLGVPVEIRP